MFFRTIHPRGSSFTTGEEDSGNPEFDRE
ncbi:hypothetical protein A2U01_0087823, partial [Trifolium medium]|nr:hypothetical protein [Trifolium medium]